MLDPAMIGAPQAAPEPQGPGSLEDVVAEIRSLLRQVAELGDGAVDPQEEAEIAKIDALVAKLAAGRHKQEQAALGGGPATQFISRSLGVR